MTDIPGFEEFSFFIKNFVVPHRQERWLDFARKDWIRIYHKYTQLASSLDKGKVRCFYKNSDETCRAIQEGRKVTSGLVFDFFDMPKMVPLRDFPTAGSVWLIVCKKEGLAFYCEGEYWTYVGDTRGEYGLTRE